MLFLLPPTTPIGIGANINSVAHSAIDAKSWARIIIIIIIKIICTFLSRHNVVTSEVVK